MLDRANWPGTRGLDEKEIDQRIVQDVKNAKIRQKLEKEGQNPYENLLDPEGQREFDIKVIGQESLIQAMISGLTGSRK